ncbi:MAG: O-antigen ligase family protein [Gammaproteobacteria bacterium]|nr:O-antigen ligase family protein [Gammaproteobacteria bacterium]
MAISWATLSIDPFASWSGFQLSSALILIFLLTIQFASNRQRIRGLGYAIVLSGVFQAVYGAYMTLSGANHGLFLEYYLNNDVATGTFINRNHLAGYLEMALAVGIGLLIAELRGGEGSNGWRQRVRGWIHLVFSTKARIRLYLVLMVIALVLTHSRGGNSAFFISMLVAGVIGLILSRHAPKSTVILLASLVVIDILIVGTFFGVEKVAQRLEETRLERETRDEVDIYSIKLVGDHPLTGTGLGSFYGAFMPYKGDDVLLYYDHAHNDYLEFASETGWIGLGLLGLLVAVSFVSALIAQARRHDPLMRGISFAVIMGVIALLIHSSVDYNLQIPANAATFMVLLAFGWISLQYRSGMEHEP